MFYINTEVSLTEEIITMFLSTFTFIVIPILIYISIKKRKQKNQEVKELKKQLNEKQKNEAYLIFPYRKNYLLSENELHFYKSLKEIAEKLNLTILSKVRLADLIYVTKELNEKEQWEYYQKISSKHVDFILCEKDNLTPKLIIELNDNTHKSEIRIERDRFVKNILEKCGYKILFTYGTGNLENQIINKLSE